MIPLVAVVQDRVGAPHIQQPFASLFREVPVKAGIRTVAPFRDVTVFYRIVVNAVECREEVRLGAAGLPRSPSIVSSL